MLTLIKNDFIYLSTLGDDSLLPSQLNAASLGDGSALFAYNTFLGFGTGWDAYYGPYRSHALAVTMAVKGYTAGTQLELAHRRILTPVLAADANKEALFLYEATSSGTSGVGAGYQALTVNGTTVTEGTAVPLTGGPSEVGATRQEAQHPISWVDPTALTTVAFYFGVGGSSIAVDRITFLYASNPSSGTVNVGIASLPLPDDGTSFAWESTPASLTLPAGSSGEITASIPRVTLSASTVYALVFQHVSGDGANAVDVHTPTQTISGGLSSSGAVLYVNGAFGWSGFGSYYPSFRLLDSTVPSPDYTYKAAPTAALPGTSTFFVHRDRDLNPSPSTSTTPRADIDKVTITSGAVSHTTIASGLAGYLDLRGVVPIDATTAYSVAAQTGTSLRFYRLDTGGSVTTDDITFETPMDGAAPYPGTTSAYPAEIFSWGPDPDGPSGPAHPWTSDVVRRWGISHDGTAFNLDQLPLDQIDPHTQPPGTTGTSFTTDLNFARYVPVGDQLFVVRYVFDNSIPSPANDTYLRITQYDGVSGAVVDDVWTAAPPPATGMRRFSQPDFTAFYDASLNQLAVAQVEFLQETATSNSLDAIRLATFEITGFPISESIRSSASVFLG